MRARVEFCLTRVGRGGARVGVLKKPWGPAPPRVRKHEEKKLENPARLLYFHFFILSLLVYPYMFFVRNLRSKLMDLFVEFL